MARYIEQGKSIFIPFKDGVSITDSQLHLRMYKTEEMFKRYGQACGEVDVLCEYAPVVRCKDCVHCRHTYDPKSGISHQVCGYVGFNPVQSSQVADDFYCSYGERREANVE